MSERGRRIAAVALAVLAALALLLALVSGYAWRAVFDSDQFADRATVALGNQAVRDEAGRRITDELVAADPDLVAVRPVLEAVVSGIAGGGAFQDLFRAGVRDLHRTILKRDEDTVTLTLADIGTTIRGALEAFQPKLAKKIPPGIETNLLESDPPKVLVDIAQFGDDTQWLPIALLIVGLLAAIGALRVAVDPRRAGVAIGVSLALVAVLTIVGLQAGRAILLTSLDDQGLRDAAAAVWAAYMDDLRTALFLLAGCGAVIAAAASSLLRPVDVGAQLRRGWGAATAEPQRRGWRAIRAVVLIVLGIVIVIDTGAFLSLVALVVGLYIAYAGVAELMRLTLPAPDEAAADQRIGRSALIATAIVAGAIFAAGAIFIGVGGISERSEAIETVGCNGSEELCDRPFDKVAFPATHNAMSAATNQRWLFAQQGHGFADQLHDGIRGLLIDAHYGDPTKGGVVKTDLSDISRGERKTYEEELGPQALDAALRIRDRIVDSPVTGDRGVYLCHRFCELGALPIDEAFGQYRDFLAANPDEVLAIDIEDYVEPADIAAAVKRTGLDEYVYKGPLGDPWPTLQDMIDSGGRVVMLAENEGGGRAYRWYHPAYKKLLQETPYSFKTPAELVGRQHLDDGCEPNRGPDTAPLFLVNHWVDTSPAPKPANADKVNAQGALMKRIKRCQTDRDLLASLIAVDFYERGDLFDVVRKLNAQRGSG